MAENVVQSEENSVGETIAEEGKDLSGFMSEVQLLRWEISLLKRENALLAKTQGRERSSRTPQLSLNDLRVDENCSTSTDAQAFRMGLNEISTLIPEFDPAKSGHQLCEWINNVENLKNIYAWDERTVMFYATLRLTGAARLWYLSQKNSIKSWYEFKSEMLRSFPNSGDDSSVLLKIMSRRKQPDECVEVYLYSIAALAAKINLPETTTIKYIISGLADQNLKNVLVASNCKSVNELLIKIKNYEEIELQNSQRRELTAANSKMWTNAKKNFSEQKQKYHETEGRRIPHFPQSNKRTRQEDEVYSSKRLKARSENQKRCFKCDEEGHIAASCPLINKSRLCFKCRKVGHFAKDCKLVGHISDYKEGKGEYFKNVVVKNQCVQAYVDLGSDCSTIKEECAIRLSLRIDKSDKILHGFGGTAIKVIGVSQEKIKIDGIEKDIEIAVVPDSAQTFAMIVGKDFMDSPDVKIIKSWQKFEIISTHSSREDENGQAKILTIESHNQGEQPGPSADLHMEEINLGEEVCYEDKVSLLSLINKYRKCFAKNLTEMGKTNLVEMEIKLKENKIVNYKPYRVAYAQKPILRSIIDELLDLDIIQSSTSEYASPVILVPKKSGEYRMCVDYRRLNAITRRETFPVPNIEETLNSLADKKIFTSLDLMSGYHQILITEESRHLTAFVTPDGHYEYKRVPFGLTNSPAVFMRLMTKILEPIRCTDIISYMDDILVASESISQHLDTLKKLFGEVLKAGVTLNIKKCNFISGKLSFLGHEISKDGVRPGNTKITSIEKYKRPESVKEVRQFLGLTGYFRKFVKNYATIAFPLNKLLRKDIDFNWTAETEKSFQTLKEILVQRPVLALYKEAAIHELHTDASSLGLAGILLQEIEGGPGLRPIAYYSRATTAAEAKYHSYELEALAVVESLERFKYYLLHKKFKIVTDCNSLKLTQEKKNLVPRIARWWMKITEFDFELEFRPSYKLTHVDALSRNTITEADPTGSVAEKVMIITAPNEDWLATLQQQDPWLQEIRKVLEGSIKEHPNQNGIKGTYSLRKGRVYKKTATGDKFYIPNGVRWRVIQFAHDKMGHCGIEKTTDNLRKSFWFPNMKPVVTKYVNSCPECLYHKQNLKDRGYHLHNYERTSVPFHTVHCDFLGPFPRSKRGNMHIVGLIDSFSKFLMLKPTRSTTTKEALRLLDEITQYFGTPTQIVTDRGSAFTSKDFAKYCSDNAIKHILTAIQTPRANGQIERYFQTARNAIVTMTQEESGKDWDANITAIQWSINSIKHSTTKKAPHENLMAYKPRSILKNKLILALHDTEEVDEENVPLNELREVIRKRISEQQQQQANNFNATHKPPKTFQEGDLVLIKQESSTNMGQPKKLLPRYKGPYQVKAVLPHDRYVITDPDTVQISQRKYESVHAADHMKAWCNLNELSLDDKEEDNYAAEECNENENS